MNAKYKKLIELVDSMGPEDFPEAEGILLMGEEVHMIIRAEEVDSFLEISDIFLKGATSMVEDLLNNFPEEYSLLEFIDNSTEAYRGRLISVMEEEPLGRYINEARRKLYKSESDNNDEPTGSVLH